jgi:SAM-dependent methyltransferase
VPDILTTEHPAKWSESVLVAIAEVVGAEVRRVGHSLEVLDPFAGIGRGRLAEALGPSAELVIGIELQPEWLADPRTFRGDATRLEPGWTGRFDAICTSPCLEQSHRILTDDLRWVAAGDVQVGDAVLAFDENGPGLTTTGRASRRRWRRAEVVRSVPRSVECLRVILANGDEIVTTPEHPWLASRYAYGGMVAEWITSSQLMGENPLGRTKGHRRGARQPYYVHRQVEPWVERRSFDAGWLSGLFDGEGSLSLGVHGSPKMVVCQVEGPVLDRAERLMADFGYEPNRIARKGIPDHYKPMGNLYVTGGFPGLLKALGELRPVRLLSKWEQLDIGTRTVEAEKVGVVAVESAGRRDIQEIETSAGTYFGEGYLMHNCYGNRLADHHDAKDPCGKCGGSRQQGVETGWAVCPTCKGTGLSWRNTYAHALRRQGGDLVPGSAAGMHWGREYRMLHRDALNEMVRVTKPGGLLVVNMSNHLKTLVRGEPPVEQQVVEWWVNRVIVAGCFLRAVLPVPTPRNRNGANADVRADGEVLIIAHTPSPRRPA